MTGMENVINDTLAILDGVIDGRLSRQEAASKLLPLIPERGQPKLELPKYDLRSTILPSLLPFLPPDRICQLVVSKEEVWAIFNRSPSAALLACLSFKGDRADIVLVVHWNELHFADTASRKKEFIRLLKACGPDALEAFRPQNEMDKSIWSVFKLLSFGFPGPRTIDGHEIVELYKHGMFIRLWQALRAAKDPLFVLGNIPLRVLYTEVSEKRYFGDMTEEMQDIVIQRAVIDTCTIPGGKKIPWWIPLMSAGSEYLAEMWMVVYVTKLLEKLKRMVMALDEKLEARLTVDGVFDEGQKILRRLSLSEWVKVWSTYTEVLCLLKEIGEVIVKVFNDDMVQKSCQELYRIICIPEEIVGVEITEPDTSYMQRARSKCVEVRVFPLTPFVDKVESIRSLVPDDAEEVARGIGILYDKIVQGYSCLNTQTIQRKRLNDHEKVAQGKKQRC